MQFQLLYFIRFKAFPIKWRTIFNIYMRAYTYLHAAFISREATIRDNSNIGNVHFISYPMDQRLCNLSRSAIHRRSCASNVARIGPRKLAVSDDKLK